MKRQIQDVLGRRKATGAPTEFDIILHALNNFESDRIFQNEREFETAVYTHLKAKFPNYDIQWQYGTKEGRAIDIVVNHKIAIELKIAENRGNLDDGFSKIVWYKEKGGFNQLAIVILDVGMMSFEDLKEYQDLFSEKGAKVVIKKGRLSRPNFYSSGIRR